MKIFFFFHSKTEADQKKCINIPNNVPFYFLQLPSPLSFERKASLFVQINQYKNNNPIYKINTKTTILYYATEW